MWARIVEIMLGFWLMASPFVFRLTETEPKNWVTHLSCGLAVIIFGFASYWRRTKWAHFLTLAVALWLILSGYSAGHPAPPSAQNQIVVGLLLGMFSIVPNQANQIPAEWRKFYKDKADGPEKPSESEI